MNFGNIRKVVLAINRKLMFTGINHDLPGKIGIKHAERLALNPFTGRDHRRNFLRQVPKGLEITLSERCILIKTVFEHAVGGQFLYFRKIMRIAGIFSSNLL